MSSSIIRLIPDNPEYIPVQSAQIAAQRLVASLFPKAERVNVLSTEQTNFIDPGGNLEKIICPICEREVSIEWWQQAMSRAYETGFTALTVTMPCCDERSSLNDLTYVWDAGFARFVVEVHDPQDDITAEELILVAKLLGCNLKKIKAHY
jgi:hypothetical protein